MNKTNLSKIFRLCVKKISCNKKCIFLLQDYYFLNIISKKKNDLDKKFIIENSKFFTIKQFIEFSSGLKSINQNDILLNFFSIIEKKDKKYFKRFTEWIPGILNNFQNIDINLVDIKNFFQSVITEELIKNYYEISKKKKSIFLKKIQKYYFEFKSFLLKKNITYNGLLLKKSIQNIDIIFPKKFSKIIFLNKKNSILNTWEENFIEKINSNKKIIFYQIPNQKLISKTFKINKNKYFKNLKIINVNNEIEQVKIIEKIIEKFSNNKCIKKILLILGDNHLLIPIINLTNNKKINISFNINYPFKIIPIHYTFISIFNFLLNKNKLFNKKFVKNDIIKFLSNGYIQKFFSKTKFLLNKLNKKYHTHYISFNLIKKFLIKTDIEIIFQINTNKIYSILNGLLSFIRKLKNFLIKNYKKHFIELKFISKIEYYIQKLKIISRKKTYLFDGIRDIYNIYNQFVNTENINFIYNKICKNSNQYLFINEFKELKNFFVKKFDISIITSLNDGIIPPKKNIDLWSNNQLINNEKYFFSFFNKIYTSSKRTYAIYKSNPDEINSGEKSNFLRHIIYKFNTKVKKYNLPFAPNQNVINPISIEKTNLINKRLHEICMNGISPSSIHLYNYDPILFYYNKILKIENFKSNSYKTNIGNIVHGILKTLYISEIESFLTLKKIKKIKGIINNKIIDFFYNKKNIFSFEETSKITMFLIEDYIKKFILLDEKLIKKGNKIFINKIEQKFSTCLNIKKSRNIILHGIIDRVDQYNGINRIIDYKIGKFHLKEINISNYNIKKIFEHPKYHNIMQLIFYIYLWFKYDIKNQKSPVAITIISPNKNNIISKILINFFDEKKPYIMYKDYIKNFLPFLTKRIKNILDVKKSIKENI
ncbi:PD-(D/E)XK nuclease family protein [Blattabacterium cuenoti]|uniref:PD-(D/E)XK nuclease family protein n=1 Tax=Blattabacterium cuenoti TaxID=1653831 RepID=UPI00163B8B4B|nr:PD-(D/E)XK nuclease family protein [Blattabacterium cuenoti]